jgi:hypothetical protein
MPKKPPVVDPGHVPLVVATDVVAIDRGPDYVQITFGFDQMFGRKSVQEQELSGRVVLTMRAFAALKAALAADNAEIAAQVLELVH